MAYYIFLKPLRSLEEHRKNPHVKIPPKSPCANFQSLGIFKNQFLSVKEFFPSLSAGPAHRTPSSSSRTDAEHARRRRWPASCRLPGRPDAPTGREKRSHLFPLHFPPLIDTIPPSSISETGAFNPTIEASSRRPLEALDPPPPRLRPIKVDPPPVKHPTPPKPSLLALTVPSPSSFRAELSVAGEPPFHRLPSRGDPAIEFAGPPSPSPALLSELSGTGAAGGRAPESGNGCRSMVDRSPGGPRPVDPAHGFFSSEINPKFHYFRQFALKPLGFSKINPQSIIFQSDPRV
jgi:hypothetical protein